MKSEKAIKDMFLEILHDVKYNPPLNEMVKHDLLVRLKTLRDILEDDEIEKLYQELISSQNLIMFSEKK